MTTLTPPDFACDKGVLCKQPDCAGHYRPREVAR
jgi:hypothetical protein